MPDQEEDLRHNDGRRASDHCESGNRCHDMIRLIEWGKSTRFFVGGGVFIMALASVGNIALQARGTSAQLETAAHVGEMTAKIDSLSGTVQLIARQVERIQRKQDWQDLDIKTTRIFVNENARKIGRGKRLGLDAFEPPESILTIDE